MERSEKAQYLAITIVTLAATIACGKGGSGKGGSGDGELPASGNFVADTGFRPNKHGFPFKNTGGQYPRTPGLVDANVMVKMFGKEACVGGNASRCKLTPPAMEWAGMINRAMNGGQCEGMAVSSLTFFQKIDDPGKFGASSAHDMRHAQVSPLIGYYWAWQAVDPMLRETMIERRRTTPVQVVEKLSSMMKSNQMATLAIWAPRPQRGGHAVTPYAIEEKGNNTVWIRIYDNNYPDKERYIIVDKSANTWRYDVAALNPDVPKRPWFGDAESRSIAVLPIATRLKKAECPFCKSARGKTVIPRGAEISMVDPDGKKLGYEGEGDQRKLVNEIPDADVVDLTAFLEDADAPEPIFILPADKSVDITIKNKPASAKPDDDGDDEDEATSVAVFSNGAALSVGKSKDRTADQKDTLSLSGDGTEVRYKTATGKVPRLRLSMDDDKKGISVGIKNIQADPDDEVELKLDAKIGRVHVQGGGKKTEKYDLKVKHVNDDSDDDEVEHKDVKFKLGESHAIDVRTKPVKPKLTGVGPAAAPPPPSIQRGKPVKMALPKAALATKPADKPDDKAGDKGADKGAEKPERPKLGGLKVPPAPPATKPPDKPKPALSLPKPAPTGRPAPPKK